MPRYGPVYQTFVSLQPDWLNYSCCIVFSSLYCISSPPKRQSHWEGAEEVSQRTEILCTIFRHWIWAASCQPHSTFVVSHLGSRCPPPKAGESNGLGLRLLRQDWRACTDRTQCHGQFWYQACPFGCHRSPPWALGPVCGYNHVESSSIYMIWGQVMEKSSWTTVCWEFWCEVKRHTTVIWIHLTK